MMKRKVLGKATSEHGSHRIQPVRFGSVATGWAAAMIGTRRRQKRRRERGYVMIVTALSVVGLAASSALAVDVSGWYVQGAEIQRAADNAALAGVVWLPDLPKATAEAKKVAAENGFVEGDHGTKIKITRRSRYEMSVEILTNGNLYFGGAFMKNPKIRRIAQAQYTLAAPLGSPESAMGMGDQVIGSFGPQQYWLAINGYCKGREQGDLLSVRYTANYDRCPPFAAATTTTNESYDPEGYWFVVDVPESSAAIDVQAYDAGECDLTAAGGWGEPPRLEWTLYGADATPLDDSDNPKAGQLVTDTASGCNTMTTLFTIPAGAKSGRWLMNVHSRESDASNGINRFGLWAKRASDAQPCSQLTEAKCPRMFARDHIPMLVWGAAQPTFPLVDIATAHANKELVVSLFDSAEGMESVQLLDPNGTPVPFTYQTTDGDYGPSTNDSCAEGPCLRVDVTGTWAVPGQIGGSYGSPSIQDRFNNRTVEIRVQLPDKDALAAYPNGWWKLRYKTKAGAAATDRTTWSVSLQGDPVKLSA